MKANPLLVFISFALAALVIYQNWNSIAAFFSSGSSGKFSAAGGASSAHAPQAEEAMCFLFGAARRGDTAATSGTNTLSDTIRIWLDADNKNDCRAQAETYCLREIVAKGYSPYQLKVKFRPAPSAGESAIGAEAEYKISGADCASF
ncbi:hypothetical protein K2X30_10440 [bacterium]|jgi:hypothetical protein|nr:hypothetical protein [bacterium]